MQRDMSFFKNVYQVDGDFGGEPAKIPVFYYDAMSITGIFPAKMSALKKFMPKSSFHPAPLFPGVGAVAVTCFEYRDTDIRPYNEISVSIPMTYGTPSVVPSASLLTGLMKNRFDVFVHHLPVTTKIALDGGVNVYNYPKFLASIEFDDRGDEIVVTLAEDGETIFKVIAKKIPARDSKTYRYVTYPVKDDCAQHADVLVNAKLFGQTAAPGSLRIELGETHRIAAEYKSALLSRTALIHQYSPEFQAILYGPSRLE